MDTLLKKICFLLLIMCIYAVYPSQGALYSPEQQKLVISRLNHVIAYQQHLFNALPAQLRSSQSFHNITGEMLESLSNQETILAKLIDNFFALKLFPKIEQFLVAEFRRKEMGKPFVSYMKLSEPLTIMVVSETPTKDVHLARSGAESKIVRVFETNEGIEHFDQQFRAYVYRIAYDRGLMVRRGSYLYVDADLNGIPESLYFLSKYVDEKRNFNTCATLIANGENIIKNTAYHQRYVDTLFMVMSYIMDNFPFEQYELYDDYAQAL